jgi:hypothetical protein
MIRYMHKHICFRRREGSVIKKRKAKIAQKYYYY